MSRQRVALRPATAGLLALSLVFGAGSARAAPRLENGFSFAAGGDLIGPDQTLRGPPDPKLEAVAKHFRDADLGFANNEGSIFDLSTFKGWQADETGGGWPIAPAAVARDLKALGITMM